MVQVEAQGWTRRSHLLQVFLPQGLQFQVLGLMPQGRGLGILLAYPTWCFPFGSLKRLKRALQPADLAGCPAVGFYKLAIGENSLLGESIPWVVLQEKLFGFLAQGRLAAFFAPSGAELLEADVLVFLAPPWLGECGICYQVFCHHAVTVAGGEAHLAQRVQGNARHLGGSPYVL